MKARHPPLLRGHRVCSWVFENAPALEKIAQRFQGRVPVGTYDDMIQDLNLEQLARSNEIPGDSDVRLRRIRLSARMVMQEHNRRCGDRDCRFEHFARMHKQGIQCADGDEVMTFNPAPRVQKQHDETFAFRVKIWGRDHMDVPVVGRPFRCVANLHVLGKRAFAQRDNFVFFRLGFHNSPNAARWV